MILLKSRPQRPTPKDLASEFTLTFERHSREQHMRGSSKPSIQKRWWRAFRHAPIFASIAKDVSHSI